ncbi:hypothetical protein LOS1_00084 [Campylobacter phage vB_CjeM_Los1]|uniref:Exonuclease n=1 Tax=Campylobacter phage vB_CjeM_Los1 TaxID=1904491 RepID=A0A1D8EXH7_9CAUD|nr:hypothetical protein FDH13_gp084 [Campylobacter phage vB_CjeM_Los1]AOT25905.1 hypothetical protein LOS1_00084 [Campylobacter phage vB_CjeM_Los1]
MYSKFINEAVSDDMLKAINVANWKTGLDFRKDYEEIESHGKKALEILDKLAKGGYNSKQYYNIYSDLRDELWNIHDRLLSYKNKMPWFRDELQSPELKRYREIIKDYIYEINQAMKDLKSDYAVVSHISNRNLESIIKAIIDEYERLYEIVEKIALSQ